MHKTVVINAVGLTPALLGPHTPNLNRLAGSPSNVATIREVTPAVTCSAQTTYLTGVLPQEHGIVGNGWYFKDTCEVRFWHQSDKLVQRPRLWDAMRRRDPNFTCANLFWWYAMYSSCDVTVTPRPMYPADGRKIPDVWTWPTSLRHDLQRDLGQFPLFKFWGPMTSIDSTRWIAGAASVLSSSQSTGQNEPRTECDLTLVYLPHLDYVLQREGPNGPTVARQVAELDGQIGHLLEHFGQLGAHVLVLSEYGIAEVGRAIHINRRLRELQWIEVRRELRDMETLDSGASRAFAVADHQIAHVYIRDDVEAAARELLQHTLRELPGVARVLVGHERAEVGLDHDRAGDIVCLAEPDAWFTYYYWLDDARAPDFARTVDIHRKPGYDPCELFIDPNLRLPKLRIARKLLARKLGFRNLLDVIPLDASLVKGSHGVPATDPNKRPLLISSEPRLLGSNDLAATDVYGVIERHLTAD
ncbi:MAG: alkaline phosphatase family protein [Tepidisphaeraceae bacterium]